MPHRRLPDCVGSRSRACPRFGEPFGSGCSKEVLCGPAVLCGELLPPAVIHIGGCESCDRLARCRELERLGQPLL